MERWWADEIARFQAVSRSRASERPRASSPTEDTERESEEGQVGKRDDGGRSDGEEVKKGGDSASGQDQWGATLPGHGGT